MNFQFVYELRYIARMMEIAEDGMAKMCNFVHLCKRRKGIHNTDTGRVRVYARRYNEYHYFAKVKLPLNRTDEKVRT